MPFRSCGKSHWVLPRLERLDAEVLKKAILGVAPARGSRRDRLRFKRGVAVRDEVAFQRLGEAVEERPRIARPERFVPGLAPFVEYARDQLVRTHPNIGGAHDEVMHGAILDPGEFADREAGIR